MVTAGDRPLSNYFDTIYFDHISPPPAPPPPNRSTFKPLPLCGGQDSIPSGSLGAIHLVF